MMEQGWVELGIGVERRGVKSVAGRSTCIGAPGYFDFTPSYKSISGILRKQNDQNLGECADGQKLVWENQL